MAGMPCQLAATNEIIPPAIRIAPRVESMTISRLNRAPSWKGASVKDSNLSIASDCSSEIRSDSRHLLIRDLSH